MSFIRIKWNDRRWRDTGAELRRWKNMDVPQFVRHRARVLAQDLIKWTPPRGKHPGKETFRQQKKRGEGTIMRDSLRTFTPLDKLRIVEDPSTGWAGPAIKKAMAAGDMYTVEGILKKLRFTVRGVLSQPSLSIHQAARTRRGTVPKKQGWFVPRHEQVVAFAKTLFPHVGKAKSGWGEPAGKLGVPTRNWPLWVQQHGRNGHLVDNTTVANKPKMFLINDRPETRDYDKTEIVDAAIFVNEAKMKKELLAIEAYMKRKFNSR